MDIRRPPGHRPSSVRVRPAPRAEPPFDDETATPSNAMDMLPMPWPVKAARSRTRRHPAGRSRRSGQQHQDARTRRGEPPTGRLALLHFVRMTIEVINGFRPASQIMAMTHPQHTAELASLVRVAQSTARSRPGTKSPVTVRRLRLCEPEPAAVEAAVVLELGDRSRAVMLRLEQRGGTWTCHLAKLI